jgi:NAD(P)-dependent dehydrogenase (short-subunit alcohol dehydrogenase family)/pimeloyl-ACP methyl ester carboxylesterase
MTELRKQWVDSDGLRLAVYVQGRADGPTVVLVHGYPDNHTVWDGVAELLGERFRVVRYDVRGHGESAAPRGRAGYRMARLVEDLVAVVRAVSPDGPVHLVGHDWGSIQAWAAVRHPAHWGLFSSYTTISGPDLAHINAWVRSSRRPGHLRRVLWQGLHSWYIGAFQTPVLPELVWRIRPLRALFGASYRDARNGVQLYRANMLAPQPTPERTPVPVQQLALTRDRFVTAALLDAAEPWVERLWRRDLALEHWAPRTNPELIARLVAEFVDHVDGAPAPRTLARARVGDGEPAMAGQLALVTGAGSGIGRATALAFGEQGAEVLCVDVDLAAAEGTAKELGDRGHAYQLDVSDGAATDALAETVLTEHGVPDVVMANAGVGVHGGFLDTSVEDWRRVLDVNLWGVIHTLRAFLPPLVDRGEGGHIVVTASAAGYTVAPSLPAYSTTKAGVLMLAQCLAGELRDTGIGVHAICPGFVHTNITATTRFAGADAAEERSRQAKTTELYRRRGFGPEKVAPAVVAAIRDGRLVVPVTPEAKLGLVGARFAPGAMRALGRWLDANASKRT